MGFMFNEKIGDWEESDLNDLTDEKAKEYIPQNLACQQLYDLYRLKGMNIIDSMIEVLQLVTKEKPV